MGCWNKTCGLTRLHIYAGTEVYVFPLLRNPYNNSERCYVTAFWQPILVPFIAKYNDYGGGDECKGEAVTFIIDQLKKQVADSDGSCNRERDSPFDRTTFDVDAFFEAVWQRNLYINDPARGATAVRQVDFVMMRKDATDAMLNEYVHEVYVGASEGTSGYNNSYVRITHQQVLNEINPLFDALCNIVKMLEHDEIRLWRFNIDSWLEQAYNYTYGEGAHAKNHVVSMICRTYEWCGTYRYPLKREAMKSVVELIESGELERARDLFTSVIIGQSVDAMLDITRGQWAPAGHEGSQSTDIRGYKALIAAINHAIEKDKQRFGNDDDE